jgi:hypothetical protein
MMHSPPNHLEGQMLAEVFGEQRRLRAQALAVWLVPVSHRLRQPTALVAEFWALTNTRRFYSVDKLVLFKNDS